MNTYTSTSKIWMVTLFILLSFKTSYSFALSSDNAPSIKITEDTKTYFRAEVGIPYILGDNNTKLLSRNLAIKENSIKLSQLAGTSIRVSENEENNQTIQQQIAQLTSTVLIANIISERYYVAGQNMGVFLTVKVEIDKKTILEKLKKINEDVPLKQKFDLAVAENNELLNELKLLDAEMQFTSHAPSEELMITRQKLINSIYTNSASYEDDTNKQLAIENAQKAIQEQTSNDVISIESMKYTLSKIVPTIIPSEAIYSVNKSNNTVNIEINVSYEPSSAPIPQKFMGIEDAYGLKNLQLKGFEETSQKNLKLTAQDVKDGLKGKEDLQVVYIVKKRKSKISPRSKALVEELNKLQVKIELMIGEYSADLNLTKHNIDNLSFQFTGNEQVKLKNIPKEIAESTPLTTRVTIFNQQ